MAKKADKRTSHRRTVFPEPKGILIPIGGGEDKHGDKAILTRLLLEAGKPGAHVCVITLATSHPDEVAQGYRRAFEGLAVERLSFIHYENRTEADTATNKQKVLMSDVILFSGGDQLKLSCLLGGTELLHLIKKRYYDEPGFVIAGTSAGAAAMSNTMIIGGSSKTALIKGELELTNGLDLINSVCIDTHFTERGRFGRLIQTVTCNPGTWGLGLGEDTCVIITKGGILEVVGSGLVVIVDGKGITYTNLNEVSRNTPITVHGIQMHVLGPGEKCMLRELQALQKL
jgi:cyanophycinase